MTMRQCLAEGLSKSETFGQASAGTKSHAEQGLLRLSVMENAMITGQRFSELVNEVFGAEIRKIGFNFSSGEKEYLITAHKGNIQLIFRLEFGYQEYYFSIEIQLHGSLGEQATPNPYYRKLPISSFTKYIDPTAKLYLYAVHMEPTLKRQMEKMKDEMLKYCQSILVNEDTSVWTKIAGELIQKSAEKVGTGNTQNTGGFTMITKERYLELVNEVFGSTIQELGFELRQEKEFIYVASKGETQLIFRLEFAYKIYLFSLEIRLLGKLGEQATSDSYYRQLGVGEFRLFADPNAKRKPGSASTEEELKERMEIQKGELLKYCQSILMGDTSIWTKIAKENIKNYDGSWKKLR